MRYVDEDLRRAASAAAARDDAGKAFAAESAELRVKYGALEERMRADRAADAARLAEALRAVAERGCDAGESGPDLEALCAANREKKNIFVTSSGRVLELEIYEEASFKDNVHVGQIRHEPVVVKTGYGVGHRAEIRSARLCKNVSGRSRRRRSRAGRA